jgi:integrase
MKTIFACKLRANLKKRFCKFVGMNTNLIISLDKRREKKDGTFPLILRLTHLRKTTSISLGYNISEKDWDEKNRRIKKSYKDVSSVSRLNNKLAKQKAEAMDIINNLDEKGQLNFISILQLKEKITKKSSTGSFFQFGDDLVKDMKEARQIGNARIHKTLLNVLRTYCKGKDLKFYELNYDFLKKFEKYHLSKGNSINGLSVYMRTIRAIYNKAISANCVEKQAYPFENYKIRSVPTEKRAISIESLQKIIKVDLKKDHPLFNFRNYFIVSYLMFGISFTDMAHLQLKNIINGRIKYRRKKTSRLYDIKFTDQLKEILNVYIKGKNSEDFIFPVIKRKEIENQFRDIEWARIRYNRGLKELAELCDIEENLTSYVARHSFATQAMLNNIPLQAISAMLGHSELNTTQIYLKSLPSNILDDYQERVSL